MRGSEHELNFESAICLVVKQKTIKALEDFEDEENCM